MLDLKDNVGFANKLLTKLFENGFDFMKEKEMKVFILHLLLEDGLFKTDGEIDYHEMSLALKISETRARNLVYEAELKYRKNHNFIEQLIAIIEKGRYEVVGDRFRFALHDPLVKQYFENEIRKLDGVCDGSFSKYIVSISIATFERLLLKLSEQYSDNKKIDKLIKELPKSFQEKITDKKSLIKEFVREFAMGFASKSGERTSDLIFDVFDPVSLLKRIFSIG